MHVHVVQKGDTLWKIAKQYGVSFDEVKRLNAHLANPDYIVPGMKIFVPTKTAKTQEMMEHPYNNNRPVKKMKEEYTKEPAPKAIPQPAPPIQKPTMKPAPLPMPQPQPMPQPINQPINQHLTNQMMPPYMGIPYGWIPVPDMDVHLQVHLPPQAAPAPAPVPPPKAMPAPVPPPKAMPMPAPVPVPKASEVPEAHGWQLLDSSSLTESSLEVPPLPPQFYPQPPCGCGAPPPPPCGCGMPKPCGCGRQNFGHQPGYGQYPYPNQMLGAQENNQMMPQNMMMPQQMMPQHMSPFMACMPCHMWPAPQGHRGYPNPVRYY
ncbi:LysM peptidoglycan-binding domain-containing protein [Paenisporosarcina sp. NPDC076898]|uniref:LysM peptidoglycan-binding domain-containing protein n=1 Tax=unclassified Paenisporosarcina TaxID=2642018 RepID=UPI003D028DD6